MNAKVSANARAKAREVVKGVGVAAGVAAALLMGSSAFAESHGFGGARMSGGHFSAPHMSAGRMSPGRGSVAHYAGGARYGGGNHAQVGGYGYARGYGVGVHGAFGYGGYRGWGGGYWNGAYWPAAFYGWSYPLYLSFLPAAYATYYWGGLPYYYVDNVYYTWNAADNGYVAVDPPPAAADNSGYSDDVNAAAAAGPDAGNAPADAADNTPPDVSAAAPAGISIIAYPRNGQSDQQQATDKFQCHTWAKGQAGFDPTSQASSNATAAARSNYGRAMTACLEARGYTVR